MDFKYFTELLIDFLPAQPPPPLIWVLQVFRFWDKEYEEPSSHLYDDHQKEQY